MDACIHRMDYTLLVWVYAWKSMIDCVEARAVKQQGLCYKKSTAAIKHDPC